MIDPATGQARVITKLQESNSVRFDVLMNLEKDEHFVAGMFPSLILLDKQTKKPVFIIEVKRNGSIAQCIQQWKTIASIPATLYIVVPEAELANAKSIAQVVGLQARFGTYTFNSEGTPVVKYE